MLTVIVSSREEDTGVHWSFILHTSPGVDNQSINDAHRPHCSLQAMHGHCNVCRGAGGRNSVTEKRHDSMMLPPLCLTVRMVLMRSFSVAGFLHTCRWGTVVKSLSLHFIRPEDF